MPGLNYHHRLGDRPKGRRLVDLRESGRQRISYRGTRLRPVCSMGLRMLEPLARRLAESAVGEIFITMDRDSKSAKR